MTTATDKAQAQATHAEEHGNEGVYFAVFILLAILTIAEVLVAYLPVVKVPALLGLMVGKAWLVAQFYMHLRYDDKVFSWTFLIPVVVGAVAAIVLQPLVY
jgi:cytochrome c oxidase subunit 4